MKFSMQTLIFSVKVTLLRHEADFAKDFAMDFRCTIATPLAEHFRQIDEIGFFFREGLQ